MKRPLKEVENISLRIDDPLLEKMAVGIALLDTRGNFVYVNSTLKKIFDVPNGRLEEKNFINFVCPDAARTLKKQIANWKTGDKKIFEIDTINENLGKKRIHIAAKPILGNNGNYLGTIILSYVTNRQSKIKQKLEKSEEQLKAILNASDEIIFLKDKEGHYININPAFSKAFKMSTEKIIGKTDEDLFSPDETKKLKKSDNYVIKRKKKHRSRNTITVNGKTQIFKTTKVPLFDAEGNVIGLCGFAENITERERMEESLKQSEFQYRTTLASIYNPIHVVNRKLRIVLFNDAFKKWNRELGLKADAIGKHILEVFPFLHKKVINEYKDVFETGKILITEEKTKVGKKELITKTEKIPIFVNNKVVRVLTVIHDITEKEKVKQEIEKRQRYLESVMTSAPDAIITLDPQQHIVDWNLGAEKLFGYTKEEVIGKELDPLITNSKVFKEANTFTQATLEGKEIKPLESIRFRKDGSPVNVILSGSPIMVEGKFVGVVAVYTDITERKKAERALKESEEKYRNLVEQIYDGIYIYRGNNFLFVNESLSKITGFTKEELYQINVWDLIHPEDRKKIFGIAEKRQKGIKTPEFYTARVITKEGKIRYCDFSVRRIIFDGRYAAMGVVRDITEYRLMEREKQKIEKLESLGIFAGGLAHDFNNILTGIIGNISLAKMEVNPGEGIYDLLTEAENASQRARGLTQQLLTFSKGGAPIKELASMKELIEESAKFILSGSNVKCNFHIPDDLWQVEVDIDQMSQVINNLILNADQAMPEGGIITIKAENIHLNGDENLPLKNGNYIKIGIEDNGIGIPEKYLSQIFDPFFTTKQKGSGLGLSTVYSIIKRHNGYITAVSKQWLGTSFYIYLPASPQKRKRRNEKKESEFILEGNGKVLIMDDEQIIIDSASRMLKKSGFKVTGAKDGDTAIELYKEAIKRDNPFDIVILDLTIPGGKGGLETIEELKKIDPNVNAIVSSGYSNDAVLSNYKKYGFSAIIKKPYRYKDLVRAIKATIESHSKSE